MIRIYKSAEAPEGLRKGYQGRGVRKQIQEDQYDKCYLCERSIPQDTQIEHFKSQSHSTELIDTWKNLFGACQYCNNKKSNRFDDIIDPTQNDVERIIRHSVDFVNDKALFTSEDNSATTSSTIQLLQRLFNGKPILGRDTDNEERFYREFRIKFNEFYDAILDYLSGDNERYNDITEQLDIHSEYLAFKYTVIHENPLLEQTFGSLTVWNKKGE
ncbi:MAG: HNH endonuclease [Mediterranea sp.]|jgi:uncharacterized protein (TIGR02646 family)|nr:HNH endonuclease [Mediterranea sp.]